MLGLRGLACIAVAGMVMGVFGQDKPVKGHWTKKGTYVQAHRQTKRSNTSFKITKSKPPKSKKVVFPKAKKPPLHGKISYDKVKAPHTPKHKVLFPKAKPVKSPHGREETGVPIHFPPDSRFMAGDRLISVKDSSGKTYSINTADKLRDFRSSHPSNGDYTVKIRRDGKYLSRKVKSLRF